MRLEILTPVGGIALKPALIAGMTIMKMISSTSMTSIIGVTFGSAFTPPRSQLTLPSVVLLRKRGGYCEIGGLAGRSRVVLNSRVKRERPNSPETPLMR